jgi:TonB family protein
LAHKHRQSRWTLVAALTASLLVHPVVGAIYQSTRDPYRPRVIVDIKREGKGQGLVLSVPEGIRCVGSGQPADRCEVEVEAGKRLTLVATRGEKSTFGGWGGPCGSQAHRLFRWALGALYGDNLPGEVPAPGEPGRQLYEALMLHSAEPLSGDPLSCELIVDQSMRITAQFGEQPEDLQVEWVAMEDEKAKKPEESITLPDPELEAVEVARMDPPDPKPQKPPEIEPQKPPEVALVEPPKVVPVEPKPVPPPPQPKQKKEEQQAPRMKAVEVPDEKEVEKAPDDARFLSDKNRDVAEETHAKETNLEREQRGKVAASEKSDVKSEQVGGDDDNIRQLEETEATDLEAEREEETAHSGKDKIAKGIDTGKEGQEGQEGQEGDGTKATRPGMLSMRGIQGRGAPGGPVVEQEVEGDGGSRRPGDGGRRGRAGKAGERGIKTQLEFDDYERIVGRDKAEQESKLARRTKSLRRGRWEQKLAAVKSSLENFTPEVKPGNQTALKTRAAPFALYIARMHRRIHELWGFGFLEDLDDKPAGHEMNDWTLWTKIEIVVNQDGSVDKVNIARPSGVLPFDVAALDTVLTAGPFEPPPEAIRSADGKTYLHWAFHRDWRQCGTFGAEPYILTTPPKGHDRGLDDGKMLGRVPRRGKDRAGAGQGGGTAGQGGAGDGHDHEQEFQPAEDGSAQASAARAQSAAPAPDDPRAGHTANLWLSGFTHADIAKMVKVSGIPFNAGGGMTAQSSSEVGSIYRNILQETKVRVIRDWKVLSASGYRKAVGSLPDGLQAGPADLFLVVRLQAEQFTLLLREHAGTGDYKIVGFFR